MATGYENFSRDELRKALDYLRRKDPENNSLQSYDNYFRSFTNASKKSAKGSVTLFDNALENNLGNKERTSKSVKGSDGGWESRGYGKEMEKRKKNPGDYSDSSIADKAQGELKKKFGLEGVDEFLTYVEAQKMAQDKKENPEKYASTTQKAVNKFKGSGVVDKILDGLELIDRPGDAIRTGIKNKLEGEGFVKGVKEGWKDDEFTTSGKNLNKTLGFDPKDGIVDKILSRALGDTVMNKVPGSNFVIDKFVDGNVSEKVGEETAGIATEALLDPLNALGLPVAAGRKALNVASKGLANAPELAEAIGKQYGDEGLKAVEKALAEGKNLDEIFGVPQQKGNPTNVLADPKLEMPELPKGYNLPPQAPREVVEEATKPSLVRDDWFDFAERGTPAVRGGVPRAEVSRGDLESIASKADKTLDLTNRLDGNRNAQLSEMQKLMDDLARSESEQAGQQLDEVWNTRQAEEDAFVQDRLAPFNSMQEQAAAAEAEWKSVQELQNQAKRIQQEYGKLYIPEGNQADWGALVPNRFKAGKNNSQALDIYKFADDEGFASVDDAVKYLQSLDEAVNTKLNDLRPADYMNMGGGRAEALDEAARIEFGNTDTAKGLDTYFDDLLKIQKDRNPDDLYQRIRGENDPETFDDLIRLAQMEHNANTNPYKPELKEMLRRDPRIREMVKAMSPKKAPASASQAPVVNEPQLQMDSLLDSLAPKPRKTPDEILREMAGGTPEANIPSVTQAIDEVVPNALPDNTLRLNMQHNSTEADALETMFSRNQHKPIEVFQALDMQREIAKMQKKGVSPDEIARELNIDKSQIPAISKLKVKPHEALAHKAYEGIVNQLHRFDVAAKKIEGKEWKILGDSAKEHRVVKAFSNEQAATVEAKAILDEHFVPALENLTKNNIKMKDAFEYLMSKNWDWFMTNGGHDSYQLPKGYDEHKLKGIIGAVDNTNTNPARKEAFKSFTDAIYNIMQTRRQYMEKHGLIDNAEYEALSRNPYYFPTVKDGDWALDNIALSKKNSKRKSVGNADDDVYSLGSGNESWLANPIDTLVSSVHGTVQAAKRRQTNLEIYKLAKQDKDNLFFAIRKEKTPGAVEVNLGKDKAYVELSQDLQEVLEEIRSPKQSKDVARLAKSITSNYAGLKTRSFEYLARALTREWQTGYINSATNNPFEHFKNVLSGFKASSAEELKASGGAFQKAYKDGMGSYNDTQKMAEEFTKEVNGLVIDGKKTNLVNGLVHKLWEVPAKAGSRIDDSIRYAEMKKVDEEFLPQIQQAKAELESAKAEMQAAAGAEDFADASKGVQSKVDELQARYDDLVHTYDIEKTYQARDMMNYARVGRSQAAKFIKDYVAFANTTTQGKDKMFRAFRERPVATSLKIATPAIGMIGLQEAVYQNSSDEDKKIYDDTHDFIKNTMFVFVVGGKRIMLPKPFEAALLTAPIESYLNSNHAYDEQGMGEKGKNLALTYMKEFLPLQTGKLIAPWFIPMDSGSPYTEAPATPALPFVESWANKKSNNQKPIAYGGKGETGFFLPNDATQDEIASQYASETARLLGQETVNADHIDHILRSLGGDYAKYAINASDVAITKGQDKAKLKKLVQDINPLQDYVHGNNGDSDMFSWLFRDAYTDKNKQK